MARKPSERTNRGQANDDLNLTSLMDLITTLMFFLLIFANLIPVVTIDAPLPKVASTAEEVRKAKSDENQLEVTIRITNASIQVDTDRYGSKTFAKTGEDKHDYEGVHKYLVEVHQKNTKAKDITLIPADNVAYDILVQVMDAARDYLKKDVGYKEIPPEIAGTEQEYHYNQLFPHVTIGGV